MWGFLQTGDIQKTSALRKQNWQWQGKLGHWESLAVAFRVYLPVYFYPTPTQILTSIPTPISF